MTLHLDSNTNQDAILTDLLISHRGYLIAYTDNNPEAIEEFKQVNILLERLEILSNSPSGFHIVSINRGGIQKRIHARQAAIAQRKS